MNKYTYEGRHIYCEDRHYATVNTLDSAVEAQRIADLLNADEAARHPTPYPIRATLDPALDADPEDAPRPALEMVRVSSDLEIAKYPLTNAQYRAFVQATGHRVPSHWEGGVIPEGKADHPVVHISWHDATACAAWYGCRLPTEAEWEQAATGGDGRTWPWGNEWDDAKANTSEGNARDTTPVGSYPTGAAPCGALDMAGNVWEWCADWYDTEEALRVLRGGSWSNSANFARCAFRYGFDPDYRLISVGVRFSRTV